MNLIKRVIQINHRLTAEELADLSDQNSGINLEIDKKDTQKKNAVAEYTNAIKTLEAKRREVSQKILSRTEIREVFCYARRNFQTSTIEYISMDGEIISEEPFKPSDFRKQLELKEEVAQLKLSKIQYFGMKYFYDEFLNIAGITAESSIEEVDLELEANRTKFISKCITFLVEEQKVLQLEDDIEFDVMYEIVSDWFDVFKKKYFEEPREQDYKVEDVEEGKEEEKPKPKKGKKEKEENQDESDNDVPDWLQDN